MQEYQVQVYEDRTIWYQNDKLHRLDGPAIEDANGGKAWYQNGKLHRLDGPAVESADGSKEWYQNGERHRLDGPAIEYVKGYKSWYQNNKLHRLDGPAVEYASGYKEWYIDGTRYSEAKFLNKTTKHTITIDGKDIELSNESFNELKKFFKEN